MNACTTVTSVDGPNAFPVDTGGDRSPRPTAECRTRARARLLEVIGSPPADLRWDDIHPLRGHLTVDGCEVVVIAPRDDEHALVVLTMEDWNAVRMANPSARRELIATCSIADHDVLVARLGAAARRLAA